VVVSERITDCRFERREEIYSVLIVVFFVLILPSSYSDAKGYIPPVWPTPSMPYEHTIDHVDLVLLVSVVVCSTPARPKIPTVATWVRVDLEPAHPKVPVGCREIAHIQRDVLSLEFYAN